MVLIIKVDHDGAAESAQQLRGDVSRDVRPRERPRHGQSHRDRRIEVRARIRPCDQHAAHHGQSPGDRNHDPAAVETFRSFEDGRCDHPVAQQYEHQRSDELEQAFGEQANFHIRFRFSRFSRAKPAARRLPSRRRPLRSACGRPRVRKYAPPATAS